MRSMYNIDMRGGGPKFVLLNRLLLKFFAAIEK